MIRNIAIRTGLIAACITAAPAGAVTPVDPASFTILDTDVGDRFVRRFYGAVDGVTQLGLQADVVFTLQSVTNFGRRWNFTAEVSNRTTDQFTASQVGLFGFSTNDPNISGSQYMPLSSITTSSGIFTNAVLNNLTGFTTPGLTTAQQLCLKAGGAAGECETSGPGGLGKGQTVTQSFALNFSGARAFVTLENFVLRFNGVSGNSQGQNGGDVVLNGAELSAFGAIVPEPSSWAMMIAGFGLVGASLRRRRLAAA